MVTTKTRIYSTPILENFDILKHFEVIIGREDVKTQNLIKEPILKALDAFKYDDKNIKHLWWEIQNLI